MSDHFYLVHHGIKGMRWGIRRFQNKDGSLTSAGKKHYYYNSDGEQTPAGKMLNARRKNASNAVSGAQSIVSGTQKLVSVSKEQPRNRYDQRTPLTRDEIAKMSNKELQDLVQRLNLEQQYSMLTAEKVSKSKVDKGLKYADAILSIAGGVLSTAIPAYMMLKG